ncbi:uncharacterized protein LOC103510858 isoform X2 [Diaphorina citri]|uniref:Uncharacterized protein LOC103510858 isoform X1 n=1 Tax=Diaphorina citri TaxID=121845 RepID=A0A1S3D3S8_DIACI|nr:uncharacterized protein LOC103510858 isoform X1 [Diaphorina citri]XP_026680616.1 uncharacterized protein LOC103510858 isoform X2 [Diaphorina citri]KAI5721302.1 hypothetical protein M8J77_018948 [Diaphorina citri]
MCPEKIKHLLQRLLDSIPCTSTEACLSASPEMLECDQGDTSSESIGIQEARPSASPETPKCDRSDTSAEPIEAEAQPRTCEPACRTCKERCSNPPNLKYYKHITSRPCKSNANKLPLPHVGLLRDTLAKASLVSKNGNSRNGTRKTTGAKRKAKPSNRKYSNGNTVGPDLTTGQSNRKPKRPTKSTVSHDLTSESEAKTICKPSNRKSKQSKGSSVSHDLTSESEAKTICKPSNRKSKHSTKKSVSHDLTSESEAKTICKPSNRKPEHSKGCSVSHDLTSESQARSICRTVKVYLQKYRRLSSKSDCSGCRDALLAKLESAVYSTSKSWRDGMFKYFRNCTRKDREKATSTSG